MKEKQTLRKKIDAFVGGCRSGIVAVCGNPSIENGLDYVVYFHSLRTIHVVHTDIWSEYFYAGATNCVTRVLEEFSGRDDMLDIANLGMDESAFLAKDLSSLLWDMAHDENACPSLIAPDFHAFTIFGDSDLESDIKRFYRLILSSEHFSVAGNEFCLESSLDEETGKPVYQFYRCFIEMFTDDETGASVPITRFALLLEEDSWQALYAKTRTFIYLNYASGHSKTEKEDPLEEAKRKGYTLVDNPEPTIVEDMKLI